jgi:hypothetical protein
MNFGARNLLWPSIIKTKKDAYYLILVILTLRCFLFDVYFLEVTSMNLQIRTRNRYTYASASFNSGSNVSFCIAAFDRLTLWGPNFFYWAELAEIFRICWGCSDEATIKFSALCHNVWARYSPNKGQKLLTLRPIYLGPGSWYTFYFIFVRKSMSGCREPQSPCF